MMERDRKDSEDAAILDFYSDRAEAHASFFLASLFGLFTVLSIASSDVGIRKDLWMLPYWLLFLGGFYCLGNFGYYAAAAQRVVENFRDEELLRVQEYSRLSSFTSLRNLIRKLMRKISFSLSHLFGTTYFLLATVAHVLVFIPSRSFWFPAFADFRIFPPLILGPLLVWLMSWAKQTDRKKFDFWKGFLEASGNYELFRFNVPIGKIRLCAEAGKKGLRYCYAVPDESWWACLMIRTGNRRRNMEIYQTLSLRKEEIEQSYGDKLDWNKNKDYCLVRRKFKEKENILDNRDLWDQMYKKMIDEMSRLEKSLKKPIADLQI